MIALKQLFFNSVVAFLALGSAGAFAQAVGGVSPEMRLLLERCAPNVHPQTMAAVVSAESRGHQFALADAGPKDLPWSKRKSMVRSYHFATLADAVAKARALIAAGHTVSLGPAQINDRQLPKLGLSIEAVFEPCTNIRAGDKILTGCYEAAKRKYGAGPRALRASLSCYNSGDFERGDQDGYVALVVGQVGRPLALRTGTDRADTSGAVPALSSSLPVPWWKGVGRGTGRHARDFTITATDFAVSE